MAKKTKKELVDIIVDLASSADKNVVTSLQRRNENLLLEIDMLKNKVATLSDSIIAEQSFYEEQIRNLNSIIAALELDATNKKEELIAVELERDSLSRDWSRIEDAFGRKNVL